MFNLTGTEYGRFDDVEIDEANVSYEELRRKLYRLCEFVDSSNVTIGYPKSIPGSMKFTGEEFELTVIAQDDASRDKLKNLISKARGGDGELMTGAGETYTHWADGDPVTDADFK